MDEQWPGDAKRHLHCPDRVLDVAAHLFPGDRRRTDERPFDAGLLPQPLAAIAHLIRAIALLRKSWNELDAWAESAWVVSHQLTARTTAQQLPSGAIVVTRARVAP